MICTIVPAKGLVRADLLRLWNGYGRIKDCANYCRKNMNKLEHGEQLSKQRKRIEYQV